jgi:hypothetical protein
MTEYASREVAQNDDASVGDFRANGDLSLQSSDTEWMTELAKSNCDTCKAEVCKCMEKGSDRLEDAAKMKKLGATKEQYGHAVKTGYIHDPKVAAKQSKDKKFWENRKAPVTKADWDAEFARSEDFIDPKNANARPTSTDDAKAGGPRIKNVGAENHAVAPATKPITENMDPEAGKVVKGKLTKDEMEKNVAPPTAKPPTAAPTPGKPPQSKPRLPKIKATGMVKAAIPMGARTAGNAGAEAAHALRANPVAPAPAAPAAPKAIPRPPTEFNAASFKPTGPVSSGLELDTKPKSFKPGVAGPPSVGPKLPSIGKLPGKP